MQWQVESVIASIVDAVCVTVHCETGKAILEEESVKRAFRLL